MSECDKESLTQDILVASKEEQAIEANNNMEKDLSNKKEHLVEMKEPQLPVSDSPQSIGFHSSGGSFASNHEIPHAAVAVVANRIVHEANHHYKVEQGIVSGGNSGFLMSKKEAKLIKILLCIRIFALVFSLFSFTVMADDRNKGVQASFYNFLEFQYCLSVNVICFIYCAFQIWYLLNYLFTTKHLVNHKWVRYSSFAMDQVLTYLLLSASASALTIDRYLVGYKFLAMAEASIAVSFLVFKAFALATLISGYMIFKFN